MLTIDSNHKYVKGGHKFERSVTGVVNQYMPDFPKEVIAEKIASRDGIESQDVLDKWDLNGSISRDLGNAVDNAIRYWFDYGELPSNPFLAKEVESFLEQWGDDRPSEAQVAILSEELSICGTMDLFENLGDKKCIIHDIKTGDIYKEAKGKMKPPFNIEASKINQYRLQLSIYKHLLELKGWEVEELVIWWWNGKWEQILLEPLETNKIL